MLKGRQKFLVEGNLPQSWPWKQNSTTIMAAVIILKVVNNWRSTLQINIWEEKCTLNLNHLLLKKKLPLQQQSDWCLHSVYSLQKFQRKNISDWVIIWTNLRSFGYFKCTTALWLPLGPSYKGNSLTRVGWVLAGQDYHLAPKIGGLQRTEVAFKS